MQLVKTFEKDCRRELQTFTDGIANLKIEKHIRSTVLDTGIKYSFSTGVWGLKSAKGNNKVGVAQNLSRHNNKMALSYCRRIMTSIEKTGKGLTGPRKLHTTHWGLVDPSETPDGEQIGISKNLALTAYITTQQDTQPVLTALEDNGMEYLDSVEIPNFKVCTKVGL